MAYVGPFPLKVPQGGTGEITLVANAVLIGENASDIAVTNVGTNGQVLLGATGLAPAFASLTSTGGSITFTPGANSLNLEAAGSVAIDFDTDSGTATPALNTLNVLGGTGITTSGAGNTITIDSTVVGGIQTIFGDQGTGATGTTVTIHTDQATSNLNGTPFFIANVATSELRFSNLTGNTIIGRFAGGLGVGGSSNVGLGDEVYSSSFSGDENVAVGNAALNAMTTGDRNVGVGMSAGSFITTGNRNIAIGRSAGAGSGTVTGSYNVAVGDASGVNYTSSESSNIAINAVSTTVALESNTLRIGNGTGTGNQQLQNAYISGISGVNVGSVASVVSISGDHLGSTTITAGSNITVTPGANTITIAATASTFPWTEVTGTSASMAVNNGYIANNAGLVTLTLPTTAAVGDIVRVTGKGAGGWKIAQNAGETIYFGVSNTTTGVGGSLDSTEDRDTVELVCVTANDDWNVLSSIGNISIT